MTPLHGASSHVSTVATALLSVVLGRSLFLRAVTIPTTPQETAPRAIGAAWVGLGTMTALHGSGLECSRSMY